MSISQLVNKYKIKEEFKPILIGFFEMKQSVYGLKDTEIEEKIIQTMCNIKNIKYTNKANIDAVYNGIKNEIIIGKEMSNQIKKSGLNYKIIQSIFHELSYAYDSKTLSKPKIKKYLVDGEKTKLKLMLKQGIHPFENGFLKTGKYALLDECLNEAKTQILLQIGNNLLMLDDLSKLIFNEYQELQPVFETLCSVNNMNYLEFLKAIEGKDINEISYMMSVNNGLPKEETDKYLEEVAECSENMYINAINCIFNDILSDEEKKQYMENSFKDYEKLYDISKIIIYNANIEDKKIRYDKLNIIQNKVISLLFSNNDPRIETSEIDDDSINIDKKIPDYSGNHIGISKIIIDSNSKNRLYKNRHMNFIQKIKNKFSKNKPLLKETSPIENELNRNGNLNSSLKLADIKNDVGTLSDDKIIDN
jgi:hypothetical protein